MLREIGECGGKLTDAVARLKEKLKNTKNADYCFVIALAPEDILMQYSGWDTITDSLGLQSQHDPWLQLYTHDPSAANAPVVTPGGTLSYKEADIDFVNSCVTVYCLLNEGCNIKI